MQCIHLGSGVLLRRLGAALCLAIAALSAHGMSIRELRAVQKSDARQGANYMRYYLVGAMEGVLEMHSQAVRDGRTPTICLKDRRLAPDMAETLYRTELQRNKDLYEADMPVALVLVNALTTVYPC